MFHDFIKRVCEEVIPDAEDDFKANSFLEDNCTFFDKLYKKHFEELQEIGRGGFGVVCKARCKLTSALYAIKKIFFNYKSDSVLRRVIREAKNIAALNHPNVVHYNTAWTESPSPYDDNFLYSSSDDSSSNLTQDESNNMQIFCSEGTSTVKIRDESYSLVNTYCSRLVRSNKVSHSTLKSFKETSFNEESSDSVLFIEDVNSPYKSVAWTVGNKSDSSDSNGSGSVESNESCSDEADIEKSFTPNTDETVSRKFSMPKDDDSERNDNALNLKTILYIQMEFCNCDLRHWLDERARGNPLPFEMDVTEIFFNILNGVAHIHSKGIIHRDLKPQNIFYSESGNILKIGDFGLATLTGSADDFRNASISDLHSTNIGTLPYAAPEQIKCQSYGSKVDIYSLGIMLIELLNTFSTIMELTRTIEEIKKDNFPNEMKKSPNLMNLVKNLVNETPDERMSAKEILDYLQEDSKITLEAKAIALREKEVFLNTREKELSQREAIINALQEKLAQGEHTIREKDEQIAQREHTIREKDEEIRRLTDLVIKMEKKELILKN